MKLARRSLFLLSVLLVWEGVVRLHVWNSTLFPSPLEVLDTLRRLAVSGTLLDATSLSLRRLLSGYLISLALGIPLGVLGARSQFFKDTFGSIISAFQSLPSICWLPLALLWFGLNDSAILFVVVMGSFVSIATAVEDGVRNLPPSYIFAARTMGVKGWPLYTRVLLPASLPSLLIGAKLGWSYAWRALMAGELLFVNLGLGHLLMMGRELADMSQVLAIMIVIMALGLFADSLIFGTIERQVRVSRGLDKA